MREHSTKLIDVSDLLAEVRDLVEAVFMAATDISDRKQQSAIQRVCDIADKRIEDISLILVDLRGEPS